MSGDSEQDGNAETKDSARLDFISLHYNYRKIRVLKGGILVMGIDEWQPSLRAAIDVAMDQPKESR